MDKLKPRLKVLVGVNTLSNVSEQAYNSHCQEWYRMGRYHPEIIFVLWTPRRKSIDNMRNDCMQFALDNNFDYVYFIDDDMVLTAGTFGELLKGFETLPNASAIMALTYIRNYPFDVMAFIDPEDKRFETERLGWKSLEKFNDFKDYVLPSGHFRVDAIGCACVMFKTDVFAEMKEPYFLTVNGLCTEDVYACAQLQKQFCRRAIEIYVDTNVPTGHILDPETISKFTVEKFRRRGQEDEAEAAKAITDALL